MFALGDDRYAARLIRSGEADIAVCGGTEAEIHRITLGSFAAVRALSTGFNDRPQEASRPFDRDRDGLVMADFIDDKLSLDPAELFEFSAAEYKSQV